MPRCIAFLRARNVGGHTVKMTQLKSIFESLGYSQVETFIASGNVIFNAKSAPNSAMATKIESVFTTNWVTKLRHSFALMQK